MLQGGLPPLFSAATRDALDYREWLDSYWAKDLQELFVVERKTAFLKFVELLFLQSGELFEATSLSGPCEVSRTTLQTWLQILETTLLAVVLRPYAGGSAREIRSQPKVYAFDTGFVCHVRGWEQLTDTARGLLFEHLVLNELLSVLPRDTVHFWRDKQQHEVDFVVAGVGGRAPLAIECKWSPERFTPSSLASFRGLHPDGESWLVAHDLAAETERRFGPHRVRLLPIDGLAEALTRWLRG
jgi:hypothetical protein